MRSQLPANPVHFLTAALSVGLLLASGPARALLLDRGNGLLYDTVLDVTWLQDANLARTQTFGVTGINATTGSMSWNTANQWIAAMNGANYLGYSDWRLPTNGPINGSTWNYNWTYNGTSDLSWNITSPNNELAYMTHVNLGIKGYYDANGVYQPDHGIPAANMVGNFGNVGLVQDLSPWYYWYGTSWSGDNIKAWFYYVNNGDATWADKQAFQYSVWALRDGDVAASLPLPGSLALLGAGLVTCRRRRRQPK